METHATDCYCDGCCNERIGRPRDSYRSEASRSVTHDRPTHLIRAWSANPADEAPLCGASPDGENFTRRSAGRDPFDVAGNPMPLCVGCVAAL